MAHSHHLARNVAFFVALIATTLALGAALAHAYELLNKMRLDQEAYFIAQRSYDGWNQIAYVLGFELGGLIALAVLYRREPRVLIPVCVALACFFTSQAIFWIWTYPANVATGMWTEQPANWAELRKQWEYSHLADAVFQLLAMMALVAAVLRRAPAGYVKERIA